MTSGDVSDELPCTRRFVSVTDCEIFRDLFDISDPQLGHDSDADNHDQQHSKPTKPVQAIRCNSLSPSWPNSHGVAGGKILAFPCRSASAKPESPPAMRSDFVLTPRPHTSPAQAEVTCPPQQRCASPAIDALQSRRVAARDDKFPSFSNADSLKEVFDMDRGSRSPRTPTQLRRSISMRPTIGHEAPSRPNSASPYTAHIESQLRHLEKHCHGLQAQLQEATRQLQHSGERAEAATAQLSGALEEGRAAAADLQGMRREHDRLSGLLVERDAALRGAEAAAAEAARDRDGLHEQLQRLQSALHDTEYSAAEHAERMESHGQHLHGAAEQLRHERDAALQERDAIAQERDAALQRSEEMLGDLKALLSKNQELEADNEQMARMLMSVRQDGEAAAQARDDATATLQCTRAEAKELREQAAEAMRRARDAAAEAAHAQAALRSRDADLRDLEMQLSSLMLANRGGGGDGGRGGMRHNARAHLHTTPALPQAPLEPKGGNDMEQGYAGWVGRLSPRGALGGWLNAGGDHDSTSAPLPPALRDRGDRLKLTSQSMMDFPDEGGRGGVRSRGGGGAVVALLRTGDSYAADGPVTQGDADRSGRASASPPQTLSVREQQELEAELLGLNKRRDALQAEYDKMPPHGGRTLQQRQRKAAVERDLAAAEKSISSVRLTLKRSGFR